MLNNTAPDECKSVLRGLFTKSDDNLIEVVRNLIASWNDPNIKPEFVCDVQRGLTYGKGDGKHNLFITATDGQSCNALITGAKQYMSGTNAIIWTPFYKSRVCESFIEGLVVEKGRDLTEVVRQLVIDWNDPEFDPSFVDKVVADNKDGKDMFVVTATSPQNSRSLVRGAKLHLSAGTPIKWYFTRNFDQN